MRAASIVPDDLDPEDLKLIRRVAEAVATRRMAVPAILIIESSRPLSFVGSQFLYFLEPILRAVIPGEQFRRVAALLENRDNVERLLLAIEAADADFAGRERSERETIRAARLAQSGAAPRGWRRWWAGFSRNRGKGE